MSQATLEVCPQCGHPPHQPGECRHVFRDQKTCECQYAGFAPRVTTRLEQWVAFRETGRDERRVSETSLIMKDGVLHATVTLCDIKDTSRRVNCTAVGPDCLEVALGAALTRWNVGDFDPKENS